MADRPIRPLFTFDAGWMYIIAGLLVIAMATLIPARRDLHELRTQQSELDAKERYAFDRLAAYARFLDHWEQADDALLIRLAGSQLNRRPEGDRPIVLVDNASTAVTDWIEASVRFEKPAPQPWPQSILSRLTAGRGQLWLLAGGALAVFIGLVLTPAGVTPAAGDDIDDELGDDIDSAENASALRIETHLAGHDPPQWSDDVNGDLDHAAPRRADVCQPHGETPMDLDVEHADVRHGDCSDTQLPPVDARFQQTLWPEHEPSVEQATTEALKDDAPSPQLDHNDHAPAHETTLPTTSTEAVQAADAQAVHSNSTDHTRSATAQQIPEDDDGPVLEAEPDDVSQPVDLSGDDADSAAPESLQNRDVDDADDVDDVDDIEDDDDEWEDAEWEEDGDDDVEYEYVEDDDEDEAVEGEPEDDPTSVKDSEVLEEDDDEWEWVDDDEPAGDDDDEWEWVEVDGDEDDLFLDGEDDEEWEYEDEDEEDET